MSERKMHVLDLIDIIVLFVAACIVGKLVMENVADTWIAFNGPAIGILLIGELIWWSTRKRIVGSSYDKT